MDVVTHAIVGAATGALFGHPVAGAIVAVLPDLVLSFKRKYAPTEWYDLTHAPLPTSMILLGVVGSSTNDMLLCACLISCYLTHIVLDTLTHGENWAPQIFAPFSKKRYSFGDDWEWFNKSWWCGIANATPWVIMCLVSAQ